MTKTERETLIAQYAAGAARLKAALATVPAAALQWRPKPGEWSAHEVVVHCADSETNAYVRVRFLASEKEPVLVGYDQDQWAKTLDYHTLPMDVALSVVESVRASTSALLRTLPESAWTRVGRHTESGRYTMEDWLQIYGDHLEGHARQIEGNLAQWRATQR
jgi:hypothetical protein